MLAFYGPFGLGRGLGAFLVALLLVPLLAGLALAFAIWSWVERRPGRRRIARALCLAALAPAVLIPALWFFGDPLRDPARYAVWKATHPQQLQAARRQAGVFMHWDAWGIAGGENDSYLASDPTDTLARPGEAARWAKTHRLGCDVTAVRRLDRGVYALTTHGCQLAGFPS